jgi:hypothetical protein
MRDLRSELLVEYVDEQTPEEAPPFEFVERAVRRQRRSRVLVASMAVAGVALGAAFTATTMNRADGPAEPPAKVATPTAGLLDDGPPPEKFKIGAALLVLDKEVPVTTVRADPQRPTELTVEVTRDADAGTCLPHTMVRILAQSSTEVRIAAYRYSVAPDQPETQECVKEWSKSLQISLDLRRELGIRTVLAGSTGHRIVLN